MAGNARSTTAPAARIEAAVRAAGLAALVLVLLVPCPTRAGDDDIVIELHAGRLARQTLLARTAGGMVLVPARPLFEMIEVRASVDSTGHLTAVREPKGIPIEVDFTRQSARSGNDVFTQGSAPMAWAGGELYLGTPLIEHLLDLKVVVDWAELAVILDPVDDLPLGRRLARERARAARRGGSDDPQPDRLLGPGPEAVSGAALDWGLFIPDFALPQASSYELRFGTGLAGGAFDLRHRGTAGGRAEHPIAASWVRAWPEGWIPRQLRLGWVASTGPHARLFRGIAASTAPYSRPATFGEAVVRGYLGPGWEIELHRNGELVDFTLTDVAGYYEITAPVDYGTNPVDIRAYGPNGEVRELTRAIPIAAERLPAGAIEAEASLGACDGPECRGLANVDARIGVHEDWTLRGGTDLYLRDTGGTPLVHPYLTASGVIQDAWLLHADAVGGAYGAVGVGYEPTPDLRASGRHEVFATRVADPILTTTGQRARTLVTAFYRPDPRRRSLYLTLGAQRDRLAVDVQDRLALGLSGQVENVRLNLEGREERLRAGSAVASAHLIGVTASTALRWRRLPIARGLYVRGQLEWELGRGALERAGLVLGKNVTPFSRVELVAGWSHFAGTQVSCTISALRPGLHTSAQVTRGLSGAVTTGAFAEGALLWNEAAERVEVSSYRTIGRGGVSGLVFLDENASGGMDLGEEPLPGVRVTVGSHAATTDEAGRYTVWDLGPFEDAEVTIDPESLPSPFLVPTVAFAQVAIEPNGFREVNLPVVMGAEASGRVSREGSAGVAGVGGVRVILTHLGTGRRHEAVTFHDGEFYALGLLPGDYTLGLAPDTLELLGLRIDGPAIRFNVPADPDARAPAVDVLLVPVSAPPRGR